MKQIDIMVYIGVGRENAVTREQLRIRTGLSDRKIRNLIESARLQGAPIINNQDGEGYYIATNQEELDRYIRQERSRALSVLAQHKAMREGLKIKQGVI